MNAAWRCGSGALTTVVLLFFPGSPRAGKESKVTPEEVIARHLDSIGSAEARAAVKTRVSKGMCRLRILQGGSGDLSGPALFETDGRRIAFEVNFGATAYPREALAFDGETVTAPPVLPGRRSQIGDFAFTYPIIATEGLFGGALSTAYPLLDLAARQAKLDYQGLKKIGGRELHQMGYRAKRGGSDVVIHLYFEQETFHHVMTTYELVVNATIGATPEQSPSQRASRYRLEEVFGDFHTSTDGLTLPTTWKIQLSIEPAARPASLWEWSMSFTSIVHNQPVDPAAFNPH